MSGPASPVSTEPQPIPNRLSRARRFSHAFLVLATVLGAVSLLAGAVQNNGFTPLELVLLLLYTLLSGWIALAFWTALAGFLVVLRHGSSRRTTPLSAASRARVAVVMPVYNEDPRRVFAGLRAIWRSLAATPVADRFDMFVLSDTRDPDLWIDEEGEWARMCRDFAAQGRVFYRHRVENLARKSGNLAEFVSRFGGAYDYLVILDADSIMSGATLQEMLARMEADPGIGLLQVPPVPVNRASIFARVLQFAGTLYGRMYCAGLAFWQRGESNFWGHNAIVRTRAFAAHCGLPKLSGREPFGGEILSHDFVEAALLARAGWQVVLAWDLDGSFEEIPPTLIDYAKRDRRWCQGNLQHARLVLAHGLKLSSRVHLAMGVMSYVASPLWLLFLLLTGVEAYIQSKTDPVYFFGDTVFPVWPESYTFELTSVMYATLAMLFLPKLLALALLLRDGRARRGHGGFWAATASVLLEVPFSILLAPVMMLFQSKFVFSILARRAIGWPAQQRDDHATSFAEAFFAHGDQLSMGIIAGVITWNTVPVFFWWFTPVLVGLLLSIPFSMLTSRVDLGRRAQRLGLFISPEERERPECLRALDAEMAVAEALQKPTLPGFIRALHDPMTHALHCALLVALPETRRERHRQEGLLIALEDDGPGVLDWPDRRAVLGSRASMINVQRALWGKPSVRERFATGATPAG